ncbi:Aste57867_10202 [Aphanomyces stellatus]|uniref:Aste57867_10202 protein n=1 Tax=Aphanomyces stellatus TaxID=120398 RepID=A0A485KQA2_9STRA|nr:hypothetical protein As57867_010163 [Aphanomyces stellatus]VFT87078.1 Aste57867_10202 [Aphanomyces stellatus]
MPRLVVVLATAASAAVLCPKGYERPCDPSPCDPSLSLTNLTAAGTFGAMPGLSTALCSGLCTAGYYCPLGSTSPLQQQCGSPVYYCPAGTASRQIVAAGYYTIASTSPGTGLDDHLSTAPYTAAVQTVCDVGYYCVRGIRYACPAGTFGQMTGLSSKQCSGLCPPGSYCPLASALPTPCPAGVYGATQGLTTANCSAPCPIANYCLQATITPEPCPAGLWGNATGLTTKQCSLTCTTSTCTLPLCPAGYFCPLGTVAPTPCGAVNVFCPSGSATSTPVAPGYYTIATPTLDTLDADGYLTGQPLALAATATRASQRPCELGTYCIQGMKQKCPAGTYGMTPALSSSTCTANCPAGYFCPIGSATYANHPCLNATTYCPAGSSSPTGVSAGYSTVLATDGRLRMDQIQCPTGSYCTHGVAHSCPRGTYGSTTGLTTPACSGPCAPGHICPAGSTTSQQSPCNAVARNPTGTYAINGQQCLPCRPGFWCSQASGSPIQNECGDTTVYCPLGSAAPQPVLPGYYACNANAQTLNGDFTAQVQCPVANTALLPQCPSTTVGPNNLV